MILLSKLSPAETLLILKGTKAQLKEILKITFMDLVMKKVLKTTKSNYRPSRQALVQVITYVITDRNFVNYKQLPHEYYFLEVYNKSNTLKVNFRNFVSIVYKNAQSGKHCRELIIKNPAIKDYFRKNIIQEIFGGFSLTKEGCLLKEKLQAELDELEETFPVLINSDGIKAKKILEAVKGNIFLIKKIDSTLLKEMDKELSVEIDRKGNNNNGDNGCWGDGWDNNWGDSWGSWDSHDHHSHSSDSGCWGGDSGCSSSGCSGCSGCGGGGD